MASTAASVAIGSTVASGLSNMLFGGRGGGESVQEAPQQQQSSSFDQGRMGGSCEIQAKGTSLIPLFYLSFLLYYIYISYLVRLGSLLVPIAYELLRLSFFFFYSYSTLPIQFQLSQISLNVSTQLEQI